MKNTAWMAGLAGGILLAGAASVGAASPSEGPTALAQTEAAPAPSSTRTPATRVLSQRDAQRLRTAQGITLQWITWDTRGDVHIDRGPDDVWRVNGLQKDASGARLAVDGSITEIGTDYFILDGRIAMTGMFGRNCSQDKLWRFEVTQNRTYYRLREFEWCDSSTDYIDIYFAPGLR
ncbi:MAG: hypothetical protein AAF687_13160 [Pseudomonadota bacterium]